MKSKGEKVNLDNSDNLGKYTLADARRLWMMWWNRNTPDLLNLKAKHHAEGQRAFQQLLAEARADLRTDEAVERVAWSISRRRQCGDCDRGYSPETCGDCWGDAVTAIEALLGEEP